LWTGTPQTWVELNFWCSAGDNQDGQQPGWRQGGHGPLAGYWTGAPNSFVYLHPGGSHDTSSASAAHSGRQVGWALLNTIDGFRYYASLWSGSPQSWVNLHPRGSSNSYAHGIWGDQQVGHVLIDGVQHASLWTGSAESWLDLSPPDSTDAMAIDVHAGWQVGFCEFDGVKRASLWHGTPESREDLASALTGSWADSSADSLWIHGATLYVVGWGINNETSRYEALLWMRPLSLGCSGDLNLDGERDQSDLGILLAAFGTCP
jgi:hypothetical protein